MPFINCEACGQRFWDYPSNQKYCSDCDGYQHTFDAGWNNAIKKLAKALDTTPEILKEIIKNEQRNNNTKTNNTH